MRMRCSDSAHSNIVQSLERGLLVLEYTVRSGQVKPAAIAEFLGVDRSTAYRLLYTLTKKGYLLQDADTREFGANPVKLFALIGELHAPMDWPIRIAEFLT